MSEHFFEYDEQAENEDDVELAAGTDFSAAVVSGTDWTTETIINQINKNNIQLNPDFQRRDAWDKTRKSNFIESLILGLPIPQLVLAERKEQRGAYIVLDGKQRLLSIRQFAADKNDTVYEQLKLSGLEIRTDLKGKNLHDLKDDADFYNDVAAFENQPIRTVVIKNWPSEEFLYHVFLRLNTGSVQLAPQELRQALHPGAFVSYIDANAPDNEAIKGILKLKKPDFRMRDNELLLRYYALKNFITEYSGDLKKFLDNTCLQFNKDWPRIEHLVSDQFEQLNYAHETISNIFGSNSYKKWFAVDYERKFNRAIFDIMALSFSYPEVRSAVAGREGEVEELFRKLCKDNYAFLTSLETTTKSLKSTHTRISVWFNELNSLLKTNLPTFELDDSINRIKVV
ncbi:DUF262 domain-containing protein [Klebsiella pneumoniae]|uniref:DUF262 domain-containing protein n=1 Tax=Klebsiella pneumoniae TaxID=573 RepID=UPI001E38BF59|nr:DUF262 domain-containing protein [Klebsiella pneumoniae]EIX9614999.1 DUF262 domain-containing protein [Klebsiella pneumoniae]EJC6299036.1 DUF262 domain-containing protein [Klebsiella pneumoniae]EKV8469321.1 DUF262 domain-containing protein [Klebsiella pneumoniae]EKV9776384.1 DUF262 domain-containing protein [Klebsiella pneumoniae]EKX6830733.1 DUF262 domain-containing protein [Klebsiella pneumoniae]